MYIKLCIILLLSTFVISDSIRTITSHEDVQEVEAGNSITLHCGSNDNSHNFMFWHSTITGDVIGPRNKFNKHKFKFEVLSGNLTIQSVSADESGTYSCISDGIDARDIAVHSVNLIVKKNGQVLKNEETKRNIYYKNNDLWKVSAILGSIFVFLVIILIGLHIYHKEKEAPKYIDIVNQNDDGDDEDSTEELFTREPSTSGVKSQSEKDKTTDNFEKVYSVINMNNK